MLLQIISVAVLARLLTQVDYGLIAMVLVVVGIGEIFRDFGLSTAAIQAEELSAKQRDNLFWANSLIGLILSVIVFFLVSPLVAAGFGEPRLDSITKILAFTFLINGLATQHRADLNRKMRFTALAVSETVAQVVSFAVAVVAALSGAGYWALVAQQLTQAGMVLIAVVVAGRWVPRGPHRGVVLKPFLKYGWSLMGTQMVGYASNNIDVVTIGLRFGAAPLGIYNRAFQLLMRTLNQLRGPTTTIALPVLSRIRRDSKRSAEYVIKGQLAMGYTLVAGIAIAAGAAYPVVRIFLGDKWLDIVPVFTLLAVAGVFQTLAFVGYWIYLAHGLTNDLFRYSIVTFFLKLICIVGGSYWGLVGVAAGYALAPALAWPLSFWWLSRRTSIPTRSLMTGAGRILATSTIAGLVAFAVSELLKSSPAVVSLLAAGVAGLAWYVVVAVAVPPVRRDLQVVYQMGRKVFRR